MRTLIEALNEGSDYEPMEVPVWMEDAFNLYAQSEAMTLFSAKELEKPGDFLRAFNPTISAYLKDQDWDGTPAPGSYPNRGYPNGWSRAAGSKKYLLVCKRSGMQPVYVTTGLELDFGAKLPSLAQAEAVLDLMAVVQ